MVSSRSRTNGSRCCRSINNGNMRSNKNTNNDGDNNNNNNNGRTNRKNKKNKKDNSTVVIIIITAYLLISKVNYCRCVQINVKIYYVHLLIRQTSDGIRFL